MTKENIIRAMIERKFTKKLWAKIKRLPSLIPRRINETIFIMTLRLMERTTPVQNNRIVFLTFRGSYDCNPKWICEEILRQQLPYELIWVYRKKTLTGKEDFPVGLKRVRLGTLEFFQAMCSAKIIVDNGISTSHQRYKKKKDQILIETWHGSLGIKKFSTDAVNDKKWVKKALREARMTDYIISNSTFEEDEVYRAEYWKETPIWRDGHARNDILFDVNTPRLQQIREKINMMYELNEDDRICLYAPTFRDSGDISVYDIDYDALAAALETRFGGHWVILVRFHYRLWQQLKSKRLVKPKPAVVKEEPETEAGAEAGTEAEAETEAETEAEAEAETEVEEKEPVRVINVTAYPDIQELAACTDVAITDYSSWICEYMLTRRPGFLFAVDLMFYERTDRPFFFPLRSMPFPVSENMAELEESILNFDEEKFVADCNSFLKDKGSIDDGHAAERTVHRIKELMEEFQ